MLQKLKGHTGASKISPEFTIWTSTTKAGNLAVRWADGTCLVQFQDIEPLRLKFEFFAHV